jgi:hypothetical protein
MAGKNRPSQTRERPWRDRSDRDRDTPSQRRNLGFVAVDGESVNIGDEHTYVLMAASDGRCIWKDEGLSTADCFEFLIETKEKNPKHRLVAFALNYDVNMMLIDLTFAELKKLHETKSLITTLDNGLTYMMEWIPSKTFKVWRLGGRTRVEISDVFGFYQSKFVTALESWNIEDAGGNIARMKGERDSFTLDQREEITRYCFDECKLLVSLMNSLEESLNGAGLRPNAWNGAGAVAAAMLRKQKVKVHRVHDSEFPADVYEAIMHAYFGGRTEVFLQGSLENVVNYDLCSAYPSEALHLPSMANGEWRAATEYDSSKRHALWFCEWNCPPDYSFMPFPLRIKSSIFYPQNGAGWYHSKEVRFARAIYGDRIRIRKGFVFTPADDAKPFAFIREAYQLRAELKQAGHASEKALKLGLNSLYGKLAQGIGLGGRIPPFQSFYWAGAITAGTRGRLLDLASVNLPGVVSVATDGIIFSGDPNFPTSTVLGGLERTDYQKLFVAQPGIYRAVTTAGKDLKKSRGFFIKEIDYDDLEKGWLEHGPYYTQRGVCKCLHHHTGVCAECGCTQVELPSRFVGIGSALMRTDPAEVWRKWLPSDRCVSLYSSRKSYHDDVLKGRVMRLFPPRMPAGTVSGIYTPKGAVREAEDIVQTVADVQGLEQPYIT